VGALARALTHGACPELKSLHLRSNGIKDFGVIELAKMISSRACPKLSSLYIKVTATPPPQKPFSMTSTPVPQVCSPPDIPQLCTRHHHHQQATTITTPGQVTSPPHAGPAGQGNDFSDKSLRRLEQSCSGNFL
jgi:hypothetical protein